MAETTRNRLRDLIALLRNHPEGLTTPEIGAILGVTRQTALKDLKRLEHDGVPIYAEGDSYFLDEAYQRHIQLSLAQAWRMYLPLRRMARAEQHRLPSVRGLLYRIATLFDEEVASQLFPTSAVEDEHRRDAIFTDLVRAWQERRLAKLSYRRLNAERESSFTIAPWWFEPAAWSDADYLIAGRLRADGSYQQITLKLDRVLSIELLPTKFQRPSGAEVTRLIEGTWGVWTSEGEATKVRLRFTARVYDRLLETRWHPTQSITPQRDGSVLWEAAIAEPREMLYWIRGWGADVEVLEPPQLRDELRRELQRQLRLYTASQDALPGVDPTIYLWAKYRRSNGEFHLLIYHMCDVAAVALRLWERGLSASQRRRLTELTGLSEADTGRWLAFLVGSHDIGKASGDFQRLVPNLYERLLTTGLPDPLATDLRHGVYSTAILRPWLQQRLGLSPQTAAALASAVGGHHGEWVDDVKLRKVDLSVHGAWQSLQQRLLDDLAQLLHVQVPTILPEVTAANTLAVLVAGFTSVSDWIGSNEGFFPFNTARQDLAAYFEQALDRAGQALGETGWFGWERRDSYMTFPELFSFAPNRFQAAVLDAVRAESPATMPRLIVIENPTGSGKTEVALYLASLLIDRLELAGMYVAMPTQATSNQMFERVAEFLGRRYPDTTVDLHLAHGASEEHPLYASLQSVSNSTEDENGVVASSWFAGHKRALLSPFAVGTVDQVMLSVLQARHHFVRQFALSNKVMVFDEIHSYDAYMNEIIGRLLGWLKTLQTPMILLSATLAREAKSHLLAEMRVRNLSELPDVPYPRMTLVYENGEAEVVPLPRPPTRSIVLRHVVPSQETWSSLLLPIYQAGGCIAVICNTVDEAIETARTLHQCPEICAEDVKLLHARYPAGWRKEIEREVLSNFGKEGDRPLRAILVATQIIEQSLDLDFDFMVTDIAPVDFLIQRAGRLHRHSRSRPAHLSEPTLALRSPDMNADDLPLFGVNELIYSRYTLMKTWIVLRERTSLSTPEDIDTLVNYVYSADPDAGAATANEATALQEAYDAALTGEDLDSFKARQSIIAAPESDYLLRRRGLDLSDDPNSSEFVVATRDIRPGVDIICLHRRADILSLSPDLLLAIDISRPPTTEEVRALANVRVTVQRAAFKRVIEELPEHSPWQRVGRLRHARVVVFDQGICRLGGGRYALKLSREYGLEFLLEGV